MRQFAPAMRVFDVIKIQGFDKRDEIFIKFEN